MNDLLTNNTDTRIRGKNFAWKKVHEVEIKEKLKTLTVKELADEIGVEKHRLRNKMTRAGIRKTDISGKFKLKPKPCEGCKYDFQPKRSAQIFCSKKCRAKQPRKKRFNK